MRAMLMEEVGRPLRAVSIPERPPGNHEVALRVHACGVCRTDLHVVDGELRNPKLPLVPGHQIVGEVIAVGTGANRFPIGARVGVPWLGSTCGGCRFCVTGRENLCDAARFTGYQIDGGYADRAVADERFCLSIPEAFTDLDAAPLLCAGLIGYRSLRMVGDAQRIGIYGFGAAAHIVTQVARYEGRRIFAFVRPGDDRAKAFARKMGAVWAGDAAEPPPEELDGAIVFAPVGELVPSALRAIGKGGTVVCGGIHMTDIPSFPYELLWGERAVRSVANLTRRDGEEFLALCPAIPVRTEVVTYAMTSANEALCDLRTGRVSGAAVLVSS
jgi:propanol-preferring alcohol dehydrogenase